MEVDWWWSNLDDEAAWRAILAAPNYHPPMMGWYEASKHALAAVTAALRTEVASFGVDVVLVEPGGLDTNIWDKAENELERRRLRSTYGEAYERACNYWRRSGAEWAIRRSRGGDRRSTHLRHPRSHERVGGNAGPVELANRLLPASVKDFLARSVLRL